LEHELFSELFSDIDTSKCDGPPMIRTNLNHVDVVVLTKNSERALERCFNSIFANVPVNRLIVVDGYSTDSTVDIVRKFSDKQGNVVLIKDRGTRGSARMRGIAEVKTGWFLFVDSDVTLSDNWYEKAKNYVDDDVGAVWGTEVWAGMHAQKVLKLFLIVTRRIFEMRGGTHDLLVRYETVKDVNIPRNLHVFEDALIKEWIAKKGYKVVPTYDPFCIHYRPDSAWTLKGSRDLVVETLRYGSLKKMPRYFFAYAFYTVYVVYRSLTRKLKEPSERIVV
jgi:glycosyltransferase involved in cell wall biosynthesis